jgi:hypothetical protein
MEMIEEWKDIPGYEGYYMVSNFGKVKSKERYVRSRNNSIRIQRERILKLCENGYGYPQVVLCKNGKKNKVVHQLVLSAFGYNFENKPSINHKDGKKKNNSINNLEYTSVAENNLHRYRVLNCIPTCTGKFGSNHPASIYIKQYTIEGKYIKDFGSLSEASIQSGIKYGSIQNACSGKQKSAGGYVWKYKNK